MHILREKVKPEREKTAPSSATREKWWQYERGRPELYATIAGMDQVLVCSEVTKHLGFCFVPNRAVYSANLDVFVADFAAFSVLQSSLHDIWARVYSSSLETRLKYSPGNAFETFPFPMCLQSEPLTQSRKDAKPQSEEKIGISAPLPLRAFALKTDPSAFALNLERIGEQYHAHRQHIMRERQEGLTKTYNRFHSPDERSADIAELRRLHVALDEAVAAAYGWGPSTSSGQALDLGHGFHQTKQGLRYTISEAARRTVLDGLLALNHQRYAEEVAEGLHDKKGSGARGQGSGKGRKPKGGDEPEGQGRLL